MINRWFTKCAVCLVVTAIDQRPAPHAICGLCAGQIENMGRVERDRLIEEHLACKCDDRCTSARGPLCTCKCGGANHGAGLIGGYHIVTTDRGPVPTVTPSAGKEQARINAADYRAAYAAVLADLDALRTKKAAGYLPGDEYARLCDLQRTIRKAATSRDHRSRMKTLRAALGTTWTPIRELATAIADAPKIADAPFTLTATPAPRPAATQTSLF